MFGHKCGTDNHKFQQFLVEKLPPSNVSPKIKIGEFEGSVHDYKNYVSQLNDSMLSQIESLTIFRYEIRCKYCGKRAE